MTAQTLRDQGNEAFNRKEYGKAIDLYAAAIIASDRQDKTAFANRQVLSLSL
jgi:hypothetical protein